VPEELPGHLSPRGQGLGFTLIQGAGAGARLDWHGGHLHAGQLGQRLRLLLIVAADKNT